MSNHCSIAGSLFEAIVSVNEFTDWRPSMSTAMTASAPAAPESEPASLYEAIGGREALRAAVDILFGKLLADPELGPLFPHGVGAIHRAYLVTALGEALGGPERYRGPFLEAAHSHLGITDAQFDRTAGHLSDTLNELAVPRPLADQVIGIVAGLRPAIVTA
jgi:hemoglobin